jgi:hypothetical protein
MVAAISGPDFDAWKSLAVEMNVFGMSGPK